MEEEEFTRSHYGFLFQFVLRIIQTLSSQPVIGLGEVELYGDRANMEY